MDLYISSLVLGAAGLGVMAVSGLGTHSHGGGSAAHGGHVAGGGHAVGGGHVHAGGHLHADGHEHGGGHLHAGGHTHASGAERMLAITSPRFLFSLALGFGAAGELLRPVLGGPLLPAAAVLGAIIFERFLVSPLWNFTMRFASTPALTLESAVSDEATAVTSFDANGQGIVSIELDGQVVQILATLQSNDRLIGGHVRVGQRLRIDEVDAGKNRCMVSLV